MSTMLGSSAASTTSHMISELTLVTMLDAWSRTPSRLKVNEAFHRASSSNQGRACAGTFSSYDSAPRSCTYSVRSSVQSAAASASTQFALVSSHSSPRYRHTYMPLAFHARGTSTHLVVPDWSTRSYPSSTCSTPVSLSRWGSSLREKTQVRLTSSERASTSTSALEVCGLGARPSGTGELVRSSEPTGADTNESALRASIPR